MRQYDNAEKDDRIQRTLDRMALLRQIDEDVSQRKKLQAKSALAISPVDDPQEKEADAVAKKVVSGGDAKAEMNSSSVKMQMKEEETVLMAKSEDGMLAGTELLQTTLNSSKGSGTPLDAKTQDEIGGKMGADLSDVKIHTDSKAHEMSEGINAKAFTHGQDIYFKQGNYDTTSTEGKSLLAHELAHTVQQKENTVKRVISRKKDDSNLEPDASYYTNTHGVRITDHPQYWDTEGKYNLLPLGAQVLILDLGSGQSFNKVSEENKWVKVRLVSFPFKKIPGGIKQAFKRKEGWVLRHILSTTSPEDTARNKENRLPAAPGAFKGIAYYSTATTASFPKYEFSSAQLSLKAPPYELIPWCKKINGKTHVVAYAARDQAENRNVFVIGPDSVDKFISNPKRPFKDTDPPAKNANFPSAPNALQGIIPYSSAFASDFPKYSYSLGGNQFSAPPYTLTPWCVKINNKDHVVAYCATDYNKGRNEFIVGPQLLDFFTKNTKAFVKLRPEYLKEFSTFEDQAAYLLELMNAASARMKEEERQKAEAEKHWMNYSQKGVACAFKGDWDGYWHYLKLAWVGEGGALRSADWYMYTVTSVGHAVVARPNVAGNIPRTIRQVKVLENTTIITRTLSRVERLVIFKDKLLKALKVKNPDDAIKLINKTLDEVEDLHSGVPKNPDILKMPNRNDSRMYGILDDTFVKRHSNGSVTALTKGHKIEISADGSFKIYERNTGNLFLSKE